MNEHLRNALIVVIIAISLFIVAEQTGVIGTDLSGRAFHFLIWES